MRQHGVARRVMEDANRGGATRRADAPRHHVFESIVLLAVILTGSSTVSAAEVVVGTPTASTSPSTSSTGLPDSFASYLANVPPEIKPIASALNEVVQVFQSSLDAQRTVKQGRIEQDAVKTKLTSADGELEILAKHRRHLEQQLAVLQQQEQQRIETMRKELETRLEQELGGARQQIVKELNQDFTRQIESFDARQRSAVEKGLNQELDLKERELKQLGQEVEIQVQELADRLTKLEANPQLTNSLAHSTGEMIAKRKAELEARRSQLRVERDALLTKQRGEIVEQLKQQQAAELQRRLTLKEASLRQTMAELLHKNHIEEERQSEDLKQGLEQLRERYSQLAQRQAMLKARTEAVDRDLEGKLHRVVALEAARQTALARLEQAFQKANTDAHPEVVAWFGQVIQRMPPELSTELGLLQQRVAAAAQQQQQLHAQNRMLRERQLALQLSHEMESQYHRNQARRQQEQEAASKRAQDLLAKVDQLASRGKYDDALQLISQAQLPESPELARISMVREGLIVAKERSVRQAQDAQVERLFAHAMEVFQQGKYEEAVKLFEQVIAQEATLGDSVRVAENMPQVQE